MLFQEDERSNGVRTQTDEAGNPTAEDPSETFLASDIAQKAEDALAALRGSGTHHTGLDHVHGTADGGSDEPGHQRSREMRRKVVGHSKRLETDALEGVVRGEL